MSQDRYIPGDTLGDAIEAIRDAEWRDRRPTVDDLENLRELHMEHSLDSWKTRFVGSLYDQACTRQTHTVWTTRQCEVFDEIVDKYLTQ